MKTNELKPVYYTDIKRIDNAKYYFMRLVNVPIPSEMAHKLENAAQLLQEVKTQVINYFNLKNDETETK